MPPKASNAVGRRQTTGLIPGYNKRMTEALVHVADPARAGPIVARAAGGRNEPFTVAEDEFILRLKAQPNVTWDEVFTRFPERTKYGSLQVRCSRGINPGSAGLADVQLFRQIHGINVNTPIPQNMYYTKANGVHLRNPGSNIAQPAYAAVVPIPVNLLTTLAVAATTGVAQNHALVAASAYPTPLAPHPVLATQPAPAVPAAQPVPATPAVTQATTTTIVGLEDETSEASETGQAERDEDSEMSNPEGK
ncbi:hypothetical protein AOQ84DRAFT_68086 [Glonium stellatum]|uniref:Myb-like domain-containing protein n=1 Tax=Glonium stellatum TaxID=574774 RepID=A0A8E2JRK1_9PEZI|nr:hypothetical protein AOQ84DRAFT_68086 [Glonium stellatum]